MEIQNNPDSNCLFPFHVQRYHTVLSFLIVGHNNKPDPVSNYNSSLNNYILSNSRLLLTICNSPLI